MLITNKIWELRQQSYDHTVGLICKNFNVSEITAKVIINRGLKDTDAIKRFLNPSINDFYDPFLMKDMGKAVERIIKAVNAGEKIVIYGDYDVDGITSSSIILNYLKAFTQNVDFYIPDRIEEGYGVSITAINKMKKKGIDLIITVDCGITAIDEVEYIIEQGIDIIITDHHECKDSVPKALAIVNPKQKDCPYPFKDLAGVGVVFKLVQALASKMGMDDIINKYIEIAALGTVADVVPLLDENRIIVKYGLEKLRKTQNLGIKALIEVSGLLGKPITTTSIGYILAPRINAAGRIGDAKKGVELFLSKSIEEAQTIANELDQDNKNRQQTENIILTEALNMMEEYEDLDNQNVIVLASEGWHHGVIGIVASKITEKFNKPSILISLDGEDGKGSGRSISGFNIFEALMNCKEDVDKFGGHELAVGLSLNKNNIETFRTKLNNYAKSKLTPEDFYPKVKIDCEISKVNINMPLLEELRLLEPFGISNPSPVFLYNGLRIVDFKTVGEDKHIRFRLEDNDLFVDSIGFNMGDLASKIDVFDKVDVACSIETNSWNGQEKIQLNLKDIRTNNDILFKEKYYSTLEESIFSDIHAESLDKNALGNINILNENILSISSNGQKNIVLINTLRGAKNFIEKLKQSKMYEKGSFKVYYNNNLGNSQNVAVINPYLKNINFMEFDNVIIYDMCFSKTQYDYLVSNCKKIFIANEFEKWSTGVDIFDEIIPQRDELIKVYQYIKSKNEKFIQGDIFSLTREIAISYNMDMNSLKLRKILEIFKEMNLISLDLLSEGYKIEIIKHTGAKVNIHMSKGLSKLLEIKDEFNYLAEILNQGMIC